MEAMMQTDAASRETQNLIASDRVEGTPVRSTDGTTIGTIDRVMINKLTGNVAYAVLSFNSFAGMGKRYLPIPWCRLTYDRKLAACHLDLTEKELKGALSLGSDKDFNWGDRCREIESHDDDRLKVYCRKLVNSAGSGSSLDLRCCCAIEASLDALRSFDQVRPIPCENATML
jgi:hypothetical protein